MGAGKGRTDPWRRVSGWASVWLLLCFLRFVVWHWIRQPYRLGRPARPTGSIWARLRRSAHSAVYDSVINHFLNGYAELAGRSLRPETGPLVILLYRLMAAFDDEYEQRANRGGSMEFGDILDAEPVRVHLAALSTFLAPYPERHAIRRFLEDFSAANYGRYVALTTSHGIADNVNGQLEILELDSAGFLVCTAHVIGIFNGHVPTPEMIAEFAHVGMVGKLADDLVDVWADHRAGVVNIFSGLVHANAGEHSVLIDHVAKARRVTYRWWRTRCPVSFAAFTGIVAAHRDEVSARSLGTAGDLMLLPAAWGGPATRHPASETQPVPTLPPRQVLES